jgi:hypothetical protein
VSASCQELRDLSCGEHPDREGEGDARDGGESGEQGRTEDRWPLCVVLVGPAEFDPTRLLRRFRYWGGGHGQVPPAPGGCPTTAMCRGGQPGVDTGGGGEGVSILNPLKVQNQGETEHDTAARIASMRKPACRDGGPRTVWFKCGAGPTPKTRSWDARFR